MFTRSFRMLFVDYIMSHIIQESVSFAKGIKNVIIGFNLILLKLINLEVLTCKVQCKI
jgi:hypothetical protein